MKDQLRFGFGKYGNSGRRMYFGVPLSILDQAGERDPAISATLADLTENQSRFVQQGVYEGNHVFFVDTLTLGRIESVKSRELCISGLAFVLTGLHRHTSQQQKDPGLQLTASVGKYDNTYYGLSARVSWTPVKPDVVAERVSKEVKRTLGEVHKRAYTPPGVGRAVVSRQDGVVVRVGSGAEEVLRTIEKPTVLLPYYDLKAGQLNDQVAQLAGIVAAVALAHPEDLA